MTIKELIDHLQTLPPELEVRIEDTEECGGNMPYILDGHECRSIRASSSHVLLCDFRDEGSEVVLHGKSLSEP